MAPTILLLDNKDSFVWNLAQALATLRQRVEVVRSDGISVEGIARASPRALVLSPGPGRPEDAGVCVAAVRALSGCLSILGVCLGHQAIAAAFGARVERGPPCHGRCSAVWHAGAGLFRGLPNPFLACRYHSLVVRADTLPAGLIAQAHTADGVLMGLRHERHPTFGVQFHPESFRTEDGVALLRNFVEQAP